jgi:polysaccharide export outer membrane protein
MHHARTPQTKALLWGLAGLLCLSAYAQQPAAGGKETKPAADEKSIEARKAKAKAAQPAAAQREGYKIGSGDVLDILVWKEPDASIAGMVVRADGKVTLPFLKDIQVAGFTPSDLEQKIKLDLSKYIQDAEVTVLVKNVVSEKVYVLGAVRKAGPLVMTGPITALQAIAEAGGPTDYAKKKKTYVLRGGQKIPFNYDAIIKGQNMEQNISLLPGDTIVVP